jgi:hypothetical protein
LFNLDSLSTLFSGYTSPASEELSQTASHESVPVACSSSLPSLLPNIILVPSLECQLARRQSILHVIEPLNLAQQLVILLFKVDSVLLLVTYGLVHEAINIILFLLEILLIIKLILADVGFFH